jgi:uncharacterized protein (DUF736 family)
MNTNNEESTEVLDPKMAKLIEMRNERKPIGGLWKRRSKRNGKVYVEVKVQFDRKVLTQLLENSNTDTVCINMVAFPNGSQMNRFSPDFKVYQELDINNINNS